MALSWKFRALDAARRRVGGSVSEMSLAQIQASRHSRLPAVPVGGELLKRLARGLFGTPRAGVAIHEREVGGAVGAVGARVYSPVGTAGPRPLVVYYHGGGWTLSGPGQYDWYCSGLAEELGATVVSVDYRKAPEDPAPAAYDDAVASFRWISEHGSELDATGAVAVAGDSAGGNLAALVAIAARDEGLRLDGQVLVYPAVDLTMSFPSIEELTDEPILSRGDIEVFRAHYLAGGIGPDDRRVSPYFVDDLAGMAPALVQTASHDPLVDEGEAYARRLDEAGVTVRHTRYVDVPHGFVSLPGLSSVARQAQAEAVAFLAPRLTSASD